MKLLEIPIPMPTPETYFYYVLSALLGSALIWIIARYLGKNEKTMEKLQETDTKLTTMLTLHEHRINEAEKDIRSLENKRPNRR
jgi:hypothetical protein